MHFREWKRRQVITLLGGAAVWPLAARAQQPAAPVIGLLSSLSFPATERFLAAFQKALKEAGYVEGQSLTIEYRWAEGQYDRLSALAADLLRRQVTVIAAFGPPAALAAKAATAIIPIVFVHGSDPVQLGLVASLNRPGGNVTGVNFFSNTLEPKRLELLHELVPGAALIGVLLNPTRSDIETQSKDVDAAARAMGTRILVLKASSDRDFETVSATLAEQRLGALLVSADPFFTARRQQIVTLATQHRIPALYELREFVMAGG